MHAHYAIVNRVLMHQITCSRMYRWITRLIIIQLDIENRNQILEILRLIWKIIEYYVITWYALFINIHNYKPSLLNGAVAMGRHKCIDEVLIAVRLELFYYN